MNTFSFLAFIFIFFYISNWSQIHFFLYALRNPKKKISSIRNQWIVSTIKKKVGIKLKRIIIFENSLMFGMMLGIPKHPKMILSRGLYKTLSKDELEWVILHEGAHCKFWHNLKSGVVQIIIFLIGVYIIGAFHISVLVTTIFSITLALISIQCMKFFEWEADRFSITHMDNPRAVITAQTKFVTARKNSSWFYNEHSVFRKLLLWNILPSQRIKIVKAQLRRPAQISKNT